MDKEGGHTNELGLTVQYLGVFLTTAAIQTIYCARTTGWTAELVSGHRVQVQLQTEAT